MLDPTLKIAFVGGSAMSTALIAGLIKQRHLRSNILLCDSQLSWRNKYADMFHIAVDATNEAAVRFADVLIVASEPVLINEACLELRNAMHEGLVSKLVISIAEGVNLNELSGSLGGSKRVVCAAPNLPSATCRGLIGLHADIQCDRQDTVCAEQIMQTIGETIWVEDEQQMSAITATIGGSPAYFFRFMEAMEKAVIAQGLAPAVARATIRQSAMGAVSMANRSERPLKELRESITQSSPCASHTVHGLESQEIDQLVAVAMQSAAN